VVYEPPPNPAEWICDALPSRHIPESADVPQAPKRHEEPITWDSVRAARPVYQPRHGEPDRLIR
jgi:hypothetical protein